MTDTQNSPLDERTMVADHDDQSVAASTRRVQNAVVRGMVVDLLAEIERIAALKAARMDFQD